MGFGTAIALIVFVGVLLLGPKRLPTIIADIARAKAQVENATRHFRSQLKEELEFQRHNESVAPDTKTTGEQ